MSLSSKEKRSEETLEYLRRYGIGQDIDIQLPALFERLETLFQDWNRVMGSSGKILSLTRALNKTIRSSAEEERRRSARVLYLLVSPLQYFMIGLEEIINDVYRDAVTRCGMCCERVTNELLRELKEEDLLVSGVKFQSKVGRLQEKLSSMSFTPTQHFVSILLAVYDIRNQRGPHDVPSADEIQAKFCVTSIPWIYNHYLGALESSGFNLKGEMRNGFIELVNSIVEVGTNLAIKPGGRALSARDAIEAILFKNGFFREARNLSEIANELSSKGYGFSKPLLSVTLDSLRKKYLNRTGSAGNYTYVQRIPPSEYYTSVT